MEFRHLLGDATLEVAVERRQLNGLAADGVVFLLDPEQGADSTKSSGWSKGLVMKSSAPASSAGIRSSPALAVTMTIDR
jgi:hypothetical protein